MPYERLLPPRMHKPFAASLKLTFTRDGDKQIPIVWGSASTSSSPTPRRSASRSPMPAQRATGRRCLRGTKDEEATELANLRLQAVASLPHLAVFSDEAHHTYGQKLLGKWEKDKETGELVFKDDGIKKVRRTIDYLLRKPTSSSWSTPPARLTSNASRCATWWCGTAWAKASATAC
jgi:type III restriction enzyme